MHTQQLDLLYILESKRPRNMYIVVWQTAEAIEVLSTQKVNFVASEWVMAARVTNYMGLWRSEPHDIPSSSPP